MSRIHKVIYLQVFDEEGNPSEEITWCKDRINETDLEYILKEPEGKELYHLQYNVTRLLDRVTKADREAVSAPLLREIQFLEKVMEGFEIPRPDFFAGIVERPEGVPPGETAEEALRILREGEGSSDRLRRAALELIEYRDRVGPLNFQLEKADDFIRELRLAIEEGEE